MATIELKNVSKFYGTVAALDQVDLKLYPGVNLILGPNGAGKSTLLKIISKMIKPTMGEVVVDGSIGFLPENPPLYFDMTVKNYLKLVVNINGGVFSDAPLEFCNLAKLSDWTISDLSKGQKQKVSLMQGIINNPDILILDEPLVGLDTVTVIEFKEMIKKLSDKIVIISTHQLLDLEDLATSTIFLKDGKIIDNPRTESDRIVVEFLSLSDELLMKLKEKFVIISEQRLGNRFRLELKVNSSRKNILQFLLDQNADISSFYSQYSLEETFMDVLGLKN